MSDWVDSAAEAEADGCISGCLGALPAIVSIPLCLLILVVYVIGVSQGWWPTP